MDVLDKQVLCSGRMLLSTVRMTLISLSYIFFFYSSTAAYLGR